MSDDDDYMSDAFLQQLPDTRPGLLPQNAVRRHIIQKKEKKEKKANERNRQKPRAVLEKEKRDEGLEASISSDNKGFAMLQKMGYKPGAGLGKSGVGRTEPVPVEVKTGRGGLGRESDQKRKKEERKQYYKHMSAKRHKMEADNKQSFMKRMNEKIKYRGAENDLYKSQKVCEQLDSQFGVTTPHESFFWPEALLPKQENDDNLVTPEQSLDRLETGYSGFVQDDISDDEDFNDNTDKDEEPVTEFSLEEKLEVLTLYLRTKHKYCIWCGTKYEDEDDLMKNCPGNSAELHEDL